MAILISLFGIKTLILLSCFNSIESYLMQERKREKERGVLLFYTLLKRRLLYEELRQLPFRKNSLYRFLSNMHCEFLKCAQLCFLSVEIHTDPDSVRRHVVLRFGIYTL